jgi:DNA-directed RNA polymerase
VTDYRKMQTEIEGQGIERGVVRAREAMARDLSRGDILGNSTVRDMMDVALARTVETLKVWHEGEVGRRGKPHRLTVFVELLGVEAVGFIALAATCNAVADRRKHRDVAAAIGERLEDEARYAMLREEAPGLYAHRMEKLKKTLSKRFKKASMDQAVAYAGIDTTLYELPTEEKAALGLALLDGVVVPASGLFDVESIARRAGSGVVHEKTIGWSLAATDAMWQRVQDGTSFWLPPVALPCVIPPKAWGPAARGGYHDKLAGKFPLVRKGGAERNRAARENASPILWEALNALQEVRWSINADVLRVMRHALSLELGGYGFPAERVEVPARLTDEAIALLTPEEIREHKAKRRAAYEASLAANAERADAHRLLDTAAMYEGHPMYFPYSMDFRGRIYAISSYLTPYGSDRHRGLLLFAEGAELGSNGRKWLAVHGANTIDKLDGIKVSKLSNEDRVRFIEARHELIVATAADPFTNNWWAELENPWQTLAFCIEWAKLDAHIKSGKVAGAFVSKLPIQMDGTCNGAQHYAAMFRDALGGAAVNLLPGDKPEDLYLKVADRLTADLKVKGEAGDEMAMLWFHSGMIDRSLVKRCVMTYFYGSKVFGFRQQLIGLIKSDKKLEAKALAAFGYADETRKKPRYREACGYLAKEIQGALSGVVKGAHDGMLWLQGWAKVIGNRGKKVSWIVPVTGMAPEQAYVIQQTTQIKTVMFGTIMKATVWSDSPEINTRKQVTAISPNVIHSLDTAHLMLTLSMLPGIPVGTVHDSYWSLAGHTDVLRQATRQAFVQLYSMDVASMLEDQFKAAAPELTPEELAMLSPRPEQGTLRIEDVLDSEYFFA